MDSKSLSGVWEMIVIALRDVGSRLTLKPLETGSLSQERL